MYAKPALLYPNKIDNQFQNNDQEKNNGIKRKLSKQNQEFINNISARGFEQFHKI